ncbi:MAG: alpha/beta hydrolase, partial [Pseudomonadota bacterium]
APMPRDPLPFPSLLVASRTDPYCAFDIADDLGAAWGSLVIDAGDAGHINAASGHGPWPEGSMTFGKFISRLAP